MTGSATDNCAGTVITQDPVEGTILPAVHNGTYNVVVTATDLAGLTDEATVVLTAIDLTNPSITCPTPEAFYYVNNGCTWTGAGLDAVSIADNCGTPVLSYSINGGKPFDG